MAICSGHLTSDFAPDPPIDYPYSLARKRGHFFARMAQRHGRRLTWRRNRILYPWESRPRPEWIHRQWWRQHGDDLL